MNQSKARVPGRAIGQLLLTIAVLIFLPAGTACAADRLQEPDSPISAAESLAYFRLLPGLELEVVASEPDVVDPVAIRFDEAGRMWVVEMRDYPHGPSEGQPPLSRIRILHDRNRDGRYEAAHVFADQLLFVTGIQPWKGGVIVTLAGRVAFMKDTDGDGRADVDETWYTGFAQQNSQLRANHPTLALDNQIYVANGLRGGKVVDPRRANSQGVSISGMDFRFDPLTGDFTAVSGVGQFGLTFDDFGNRFVCSNRNPLKHIVLHNIYMQRNPRAAIAAVAHDAAVSGAASKLFPISRAWTTSTLHAGQFTAACGVTIYRGDALPPLLRGNAFICDPTGNLVHREILAPAGATFQSIAAREGVEFLASTDQWFRPVNLTTGPDGALYVVDMYRAVIEHPEFVPEELKNRPDTRHGDNLGRIYRIRAASSARRVVPDVSQWSSTKLVGLLAHRNAWWRETAARLILQRQDQSARQPLEQLAVVSRLPWARIHALWALQGLGALSEQRVRAALEDDHPRVREHGVLLAEKFRARSPDLDRRLLEMARDEDPRVRFQLALSWTPVGSDPQLASLVSIALAGAEDVWTRRAVALSSGQRAMDLTLKLLEQPMWQQRPATPGEVELLNELTALAVSSGSDAQRLQLLNGLAQLGSDEPSRQAGRVGLIAMARSLQRRGQTLLALIEQAADPEPRKQVQAVLQQAAETALDGRQVEASRLLAIRLLAFADRSDALIQLALEDQSQAVRTEAIVALSRYNELQPWKELLLRFRSESPATRRAILDAVISRSDRAALLLENIAAGRVKPGELDQTRTQRLLQHRDAAIQRLANKVFAAAVPEDRQKVLQRYHSVLQMKADPGRGMAVFRKHCATCHKIGDIGVSVAPDIGDSRTKTPQQLLTDILQPNRAIDSNYVSYMIATADGRALTGILVSETSTSITLKEAEDKRTTLLREEIDEIRSTGLSLMPVGLEQDIPPQDMADLISFIKNWRYLDGRTPLASE